MALRGVGGGSCVAWGGLRLLGMALVGLVGLAVCIDSRSAVFPMNRSQESFKKCHHLPSGRRGTGSPVPGPSARTPI